MLSLGYFQAYRDRARHPASAAAAVVRRLSGGGALLHDRELTYSLCLPATHPLARRSPELYEAVHRSLIDALSVQARRTVDDLVRYSVEYDHCRGTYEMSDVEADAIVAQLSEAVEDLPQYAKLDHRRPQDAAAQPAVRMQQAAATAPQPCSVVRVGGKRS